MRASDGFPSILPKKIGERLTPKIVTLPLVAAAAVVATTACGGGEAGPRLYFVQPEDGATVPTSFDAVFGAEGVEVAAVPDQVDTPREGVIHYHVAVDAGCLTPGTEIPQADPWVHFGDGSNRIELNLTPGEHTLTVQAGDDLHRTIEGLCQTITVTVGDGG